MKKVLKGISLFAITIIVGCLFVNCVNAETRNGSVHSSVTTNVTETTKTTDNSSDFADIGQLIIKKSGNEVTEYIGDGLPFYRHTESGTGLPFYCLDANLNGYGTLVAKRFLLGDVEPNVYSYDLAVMHVMLSDASYEIKSLVIRTLTATWNHGRSNTYPGIDDGTLALMKAYYGLALEWIEEDSGIEASYNTILNSFSSGIISSKSTLQSKSGGYTFNQQMVNRAQAKQLFAEALEIAAEYLNSEGQPTVKVENGADWTKFKTEDTSYGEYHNYQITRKFILSNFTNDGNASFVIDRLEYDLPLEELGVIDQPRFVSIKINGTEYIDNFGGIGSYGAIGQNLLEPLNSSKTITDEVVIEVTVEFFGAVNVPEEEQSYYGNLNCGTQPMDWTMEYTYNDTNINGYFGDYLGIVWEATKNDGQSQHQRFVSIEPIEDTGEEEEGIKGKITGSVELMDACSCDDLIEACKASGDINSTECKELFEANCGECAELEVECEFGDEEACKEYQETCNVTCGTEVEMFECCDADNNMLIISTDDNHPVNIYGPENVEACFVSQIDAQKDPEEGYAKEELTPGAKDDVSNSYTKQRNKYCLVSCKEDYAMQMPTAKLVNAGRYFTFKAAVQGTKTCYTNTIARDLYNEDMLEAQVALINAFNNYKDWEAAMEAHKENIDGTYTSSVSPSGCSCHAETSDYIAGARTENYTYDYFYITDDENINTGVVRGYMGTARNSKNVTSVTSSHFGGSYHDSGGSTCGSRDENGHCIDTTWECDGDCYYTTIDEVRDVAYLEEYIEGEFEKAEQRLEQAQKAYDGIVKAYNQCSEWETEIKFPKELFTYDYEEDYKVDVKTDFGRMDEDIGSIDNSEWYCNSQVSENGSEVKAELVSQGTSREDQYNHCSLRTSSGQNYTTIEYLFCDTEECSWSLDGSYRDVSDARYKKIISTISADYKPATLFYNDYPSGNVGAIEDGMPENAVELENKLPVALDTKRGIYEYSLKISTLGEYYDKREGDMGRLIGGGNPVINESDYGEFFDEEGNVQYICAYLVNMGRLDENFDVVCDWDNCEDGDCTSNCVGPNCDTDEDEKCYGEDCVSRCIGAGCIYDDDAGSSILERVVSLNNLFPNGTDSYNWNRDENSKAEKTIERIEDAGNSIYEEDPILSVTITPTTARAIREYNDEAEEKDRGGYSNATLSCTSVGDYDMIGCYSSFIDDLTKGRLSFGNQTINSNLGDVVNRRSMVMNGNYRSSSSKYFELWDGAISEYDMLGPSWK